MARSGHARLKRFGGRADKGQVRYERLILEAGTNAVTVRFHPRLTVVAGVGEAERESLIAELLGALGGGRGGAHLEITTDGNRRLAIIRPMKGPDRVLDVEDGRDVTMEFADGAASVDVLGRFGHNYADAQRRCRVRANDLVGDRQGDAVIEALATSDQQRLWAAAERVDNAERALRSETEQAGATPEDLPLIEEIERRHAAFEKAQARHEDVRHHALFIGGASALGAAPAAMLQRWTAVPFLAVALLTTITAIRYRRRLELARRAEAEALAKAGTQSYIGFQLQRVDRMLHGHKDLQRLREAAEEHRTALDAWRELAGDVTVEWARSVRPRIEARAAERAGDRTRDTWSVAEFLRRSDPAELAHGLAGRFAEVRNEGGEVLPLILDEPLPGVEPSVKQWLLEFVGRSAGSPQIVYLTADPDVAAWARIEAVAGHLSVLEPDPDPERLNA